MVPGNRECRRTSVALQVQRMRIWPQRSAANNRALPAHIAIGAPNLHGLVYRKRRAAQAAQQQSGDQQERKSFFHNASSLFISNGFMFEYTRKPSGMYPGRLQNHANQ